MQVANPPASANAPAVPQAPAEPSSRGCFRFGCVHVACTFFLLIAGGLVTSHDAGLAVGDWPTSFGRIWFVRMVGNVFYEHGHRLVGEGVGLLTIVYTVWLWRTQTRRWLRWLGVWLLVLVIVQGVLGGLTVLNLLPPELSVSHGVAAQTFFCLSLATTWFVSREQAGARRRARTREARLLQGVALSAAGAVYLQLFFGALLRHNSAQDFRFSGVFSDPTFNLHMLHWAGAIAVVLTVGNLGRIILGRHAHEPRLRRAALLLLAGLAGQLTLGLLTLLTNMQPWLATAHLALGALLLGTLVVLLLRVHWETVP